MASSSSDLSVRLNLEPAAPVEATPAPQGKAAGKDGEGKPRRQLPPAQKSADEKSSAEMAEPEDDSLQHRVDSLA